MRKTAIKTLAIAGMTILAMGALAGCSSNNSNTATENTTASVADEGSGSSETTSDTTAAQAGTELKGSVTMVGSTSMEKFASALSEVFMEKYPEVSLQAEFSGSGAGIEAVSNGSADIGNSSRNLKDEEKAKGVVENIVAIDGIAVIIDGGSTVANLTKEQLTNIYNGTITNWKDAGGADQPIVVIGRESGSGTRTAFEEILKVEDACKYSNELDSTGAVMAKVASTPGSIGYVSLDVLDDSVKAVKLDDVEPSAESIKSGSYFLSRPFVMATKGEISEQSDIIQAIFEFIHSDEGTELVKSVGLIPTK